MSTPVNSYTRENPSPRFQLLGQLYQQAHKATGAEGSQDPAVFKGFSLRFHVETVRQLAMQTGSKSILDYGSGKGQLYSQKNFQLTDGKIVPDVKTYWGVENITLYDPGIPEFSNIPVGQFDGLVSTDVLEHIPEEDLDWVLRDCFSYARKFIYMNIASYPARKVLPNGWNAHVTIQPPEWWEARILKAAQSWSGQAYVFEVNQKLGGLSGWISKRIRGTRSKVTRIENCGKAST
jgi:hypothetical protein